MCSHEFEPLWYVCDDDYGITTTRVHLKESYSDNKGHLAYCTKCGQVFVMEIAEKIRGGNMTRKEAKRNLTYAKKWGDRPESDALDIAIRSIESVEKIERLTTMYAQKGNDPTRTITMEELRKFIN